MKGISAWLLTCALLSVAGSVTAQSMEPFPTDPEDFIKQVDKVLKATGRDDCKTTSEEFATAFAALSVDQQNDIIATTNKMVPLTLRVFPHYDDYFRSITAEVNTPSGGFDQWHKVLNQVLDASKRGDNKKYERYMECITGLVTKRALYTSVSKTWSFSAGSFEVLFENGSPLIRLRTTDLLGSTPGDTANIYATSGTYDIYETTWHGSGGRHTWESVGLSASDVYCTLPDYAIDLSKHEYQLDSVMFIFRPYFSEPSLGVLTNQLQQSKTASAAYPSFVSYKSSVRIPNLMEGVDFEGVFRLEGATIKGSSEGTTKARFKFRSKSGDLVATARANSFKIDTREKAVSLEASLSIYFGEDSIYHPGLPFKFDVNKRELVATRGESGISDSRFYDSYHKMELDVDRVIWNLDNQEIIMSNPGRGGQEPAYFESANLFDRKLYNDYLGVTSYAPLVVIKRYCDLWKTREIGTETLAREMQKTLTTEQIRPLLFNLMSDGFIIYDQERELVIVQDKVFNYVDAFLEKVDYDIIQLKSVTTEANAKIDLETLDMSLHGVERASLSHKQFVDIYPSGNTLTVKKNRDMVFNGIVLGGRLDFYGRGYYFNYDSFKINMLELDSVMINLPSDRKDEFGQPILIPMNGILEDLSGTLFIDAPVNKSGNGDFPGYSRFENRNPSYVYYDKYSKYRTKYPRENFYFKLNPFSIDSLEDFNLYNQSFPGEFHSADIFPVFEQDLHIRSDKSFGFVSETPGEGLPLYRGKGTYYETIDLSNQGLRGQGKIEYLTTRLASDNILFFPDSMAAVAQDMHMQAGVIGGAEFPNVTNQNVGVTWLPYRDDMLLTMKETPFIFFNGDATLTGDVRVTPAGARASGTLDWTEASLSSRDFSFGTFTAKADTSALKIKALSPDKIAFNLPNVKSNVDFENRNGTFITNTPGVATELPYNRYKTTMGKFDWDFDKKTIDLAPPLDEEYALFQSTHPRQDSLAFQAKHGLYNMETSLLTAFDVPRIAVADAWVIPYEGKVTIGEDAVMHKLFNSEIIVDTSTKHHRFYNAEVEIFGKKSYKAVADYDYVHRGGNAQTLHFQEIGVEQHGDSANTYGVATIAESDSFKLDPKIRFQGQVKLEAGDEYMTFRGVGKMDVPVFPYYKYHYSVDSFQVHQSMVDSFRRLVDYADYKVIPPRPTDTAALLSGMVTLMKVDSTIAFVNPNMFHDWFKVDDEINPLDIQITVTNATNARSEPVYTGIHVRSDTALMYATLLGNKMSGRDITVFEVKGMVSYDDDQDRYIAAPREKLTGKSEVGTQMIYDNRNGSVYAEGWTNLGLSLQMVKLNAAGEISKTTKDSTYSFDMVLAFGFLATKSVWQQMSADLRSWTMGHTNLDVEGDKMKRAISNLMPDQDAADKLYNNYGLTGNLNFPAEGYPILISAKMDWDPNEKTFRSHGPIGIISIGGDLVARSVKGYLELGMARSSDYINIYLEPEREEWYFITYRKNELALFSSNEVFNNIVKAVPDNHRLFKGEQPQDFEIFEIGSRATMVRFVKNMQYFESLIK